ELDVVYDQRVLIEHAGKSTTTRHDDWHALRTRNRQRFLDKWLGDAAVPRIASCDPERFARNRATARAAAEWMERVFEMHDREDARSPRLFGKNGPVRTVPLDWAPSGWRPARPE